MRELLGPRSPQALYGVVEVQNIIVDIPVIIKPLSQDVLHYDKIHYCHTVTIASSDLNQIHLLLISHLGLHHLLQAEHRPLT